MDHRWVRAVLYETTPRDIDDKVIFLSDTSRLALGDPGCLNCGTPYGPATRSTKCSGEKADGEPSGPEFEPLRKRSNRDARVTTKE